MKQIKDELQSIIIGNGQDGQSSQLKKIHNFLRGNAEASSKPEEQKRLKSEEESLLIDFALKKQEFIIATETTNLVALRSLLEYNKFNHIRNNDYQNSDLGIIFEDLHDENVLCRDGLLYFIDTVFYLTPNFYCE